MLSFADSFCVWLSSVDWCWLNHATPSSAVTCPSYPLNALCVVSRRCVTWCRRWPTSKARSSTWPSVYGPLLAPSRRLRQWKPPRPPPSQHQPPAPPPSCPTPASTSINRRSTITTTSRNLPLPTPCLRVIAATPSVAKHPRAPLPRRRPRKGDQDQTKMRAKYDTVRWGVNRVHDSKERSGPCGSKRKRKRERVRNAWRVLLSPELQGLGIQTWSRCWKLRDMSRHTGHWVHSKVEVMSKYMSWTPTYVRPQIKYGAFVVFIISFWEWEHEY